jgi:hypothetical protein
MASHQVSCRQPGNRTRADIVAAGNLAHWVAGVCFAAWGVLMLAGTVGGE